MDYSKKLALSYYKTIATLNEEHNIYLVQHQETKKIYVKKILSIYNIDVYKKLSSLPICGIPQIVDFCETNHHLIVIESYISGHSLDELLHSDKLNLPLIMCYAFELCNILCELHNMNPPIIHRDIKPSNIMITEHNHVVLLDFNAAKFFSNSSSNDTVLLGTKGYAAPEQYGFGSSSVKTDIYAIGILLRELTSSISNLPQKLVKIIEKCTNLNPDDRYASMNDLVNDLRLVAQTPNDKINLFSHTKSYRIPGFRTGTVWKMLLALPTYLFLFWLSLSLEVKNTYGIALWFERIFCLFIFLSIIMATFNYRDVHEHFPLCKNENPIIKIFGIIILDIFLFISLFAIMAFSAGILFQ